MIFDTHLHLNTNEFEGDLDEVIKRAYDQGVKRLLVIGMDEKTSLRAIEIAETYAHVFASVGLHPSYVDDSNTNFIEPLLKHPKVVAIGETGLDLYWQDKNFERQKEMFIKQIELSIQYQMPLIIHTRNSINEALQIVKRYQNKAFGVFHCFSSNLEDALKVIDLGYLIGIDGPITFKNPKELLRVVEEVDLKHILLETDSPYLAPAPYRGKRNEPSFLTEIVKKIAEIKQVSIEEVGHITTQNANHLFKLGGNKNEK